MADNRSQAQRSAEAASLLEKLAPYFDALEAEATQAAASAEYWQPEGRRAAMHYLDQINALRLVRQRLQTEISLGEMAALKARS